MGSAAINTGRARRLHRERDHQIERGSRDASFARETQRRAQQRVDFHRPPGLQILELRGGAYVEVGTWHGDTDITVERPFRVTLNPARLVVL